MPLVRTALTFALVATAACMNHAQQLAKSATLGVKAKLAQVDPRVARTVGDQAARGAVSGALAELESSEQREVLGSIIDTTSQAATRAIMVALRPEHDQVQELVDHAVAHAVGSVGRQLETDHVLQGQLGELAHRLSASAVFGARDAVMEMFPECTNAADRRRCVEAEVGNLSRAAARGMLGGVVDVARWPILALVFVAGIIVTLLVLAGVRAAARTRAPERHRSPPA